MSPMFWAVLLILLGLIFLVLEGFLPSGGILFVLSVACLVVGVTMVFFAPESEGGGLYGGLITLAILVVLLPLLVTLWLHYWPHTRIGRKFFLPVPSDEPASALPAASVGEELRGQIGQALTDLRPCGVTLIQGRRMDSQAEGIFVPAGTWVRVVDVRPGQIIVRPLDERELQNLPADLTGEG
jgi:membrane-bound serine protease (ClpP class)